MTTTAPTRPPAGALPLRRRSGGDVARTATRVTGELFITVGVVVLLFLAWQLWGTGLVTSRAQDGLRGQLDQQFAATPPGGSATTGGAGTGGTGTSGGSGSGGSGSGGTGSGGSPGTPVRPGTPVPPGPAVAAPPEGGPVARLLIPAIDVDWVVVQGVGLSDLADGPGHYPASAMPGQVGNTAIAGHRTTHGAPFFRVAELRTGDTIDVRVPGRTYTYRVTSTEIVEPDRVGVVAPVPDRPGVTPTRRLLTLTSCNPRYSARQRIVVHAELDSTRAS